MKKRILFALSLSCCLLACDGGGGGNRDRNSDVSSVPTPVSTRSFSMGFTPFPNANTAQAVNLAYNQIASHGDAILHHLDDGVPWNEALSGAAFPAALQMQLNDRKARISPDTTLLLSATPTRQDRHSLAEFWNSDNSSQPLPPFWKNKSFDDPDVMAAYINYCRRLIEFFEPDYFAYGIEINASFLSGETDFNDYLVLAETTYTMLKSEYPDLPIMLTFQTQAPNRTRAQLLEAVRQMLPYSDYIALSHYPFWLPDQPNQDANPELLPTGWLQEFRNLDTNKPFAIAETGYIAEDLILNSFGVNIRGRADWQNRFVETYLTELNDLDAEFLMWFVIQDYDALWNELERQGGGEELKIWRDSGLFAGDGNPRPALQTWDRWLASPKR